MKKYFFVLVISLFILVSITIIWSIFTLAFLTVNGVQNIFENKGFFENVLSSTYMKWILVFDVGWIVSFIVYLVSRKNYGRESSQYFLKHTQHPKPKICVIIPAYNEEATIQGVVDEYKNHKSVNNVIVIDNHSEDKTVELAKTAGAHVVTKKENKGFGHSVAMGLKEALKTNSNLFVLTEADGTLSASDLDKMLPYMEHCDIVRGSRQVQILNEKGNLREGISHVWGNYFLAKLIQLKYLNMIHLGIVNINDIGCMLRMFKREVIEEMEPYLTHKGTDIAKGGNSVLLYLDMECLDKKFTVIEIPVSYKGRIGKSKFRTDKKIKSLRYGLEFLKFVLMH